ncbi:MAG: 2-dehydro-3-deoxyphosphogluconate aldolase, partial [Calditrichia bacterium]
MSRLEILEKIRSCGIIAVIRMGDTQKLEKVISAISRGGVKGLEITMTTPNALDVIHRISAELPDDFLIGVGSVLDAQTAVAAIHAGAQFVVSPVFKEEIIEAAHRYDRVVIPGAFTPTEIL